MLQINTLQDKCVIWKTFPMSGIADTCPGRVCQMFSFSSGRGNHLVPRVNSVRSLNEKSSILFQPTLRQIQRKKRWIFDHYSNFPLKLSDVILIEEMLFQMWNALLILSSWRHFTKWVYLVAWWKRICLPMQKTWVWSLGRADPLEKEMATHSRILAWETPWTVKSGRLQSMGLQRVGHDSVTKQQIEDRQIFPVVDWVGNTDTTSRSNLHLEASG